jgi:N-acetylglucosamine-6-phosphate deacetylase
MRERKRSSNMKAIINGKIIKRDNVLEDHVIIFEEKIKKIISMKAFQEKEQPADKLEVIDAHGSYVSPGFLDLHIHGAGGKDTMDGDIEALQVISKAAASKGVTGFLPTTMTMRKAKVKNAFEAIKAAKNEPVCGAKILGSHMEGPFINRKMKGAQNASYIMQPQYDYIEGYEDIIKIITIAPEIDPDFTFIKKVKSTTDISLSIGHSDASYEIAAEAIKCGISRATHMFNAMNSFNHRSPGIIGALFNSSTSCELIADTIHIHPALFQTILNIKGKDNIILITDSMRAGCQAEGISELGGQKIIVKNNSARLEDGTLAGSILTLNTAVKNILEHTDLKLYEAVALASYNPAKDIGLEHKKGSLEIGKDADITIFDDNFLVSCTIVEGKTVFTA